MTTLFSILVCSVVAAVGLGLSLLMMTIILASGANSSNVEVSILKAMLITLLVATGLSLLGVPAGLAFGRAPLAFVLAALPVLASLVIFLAWLETFSEKLPPEYAIPYGKLTVRLIVMAVFGGAAITGLYIGAREYLIQRTLLADARPVQATILESHVKTSKSADTDGRPLRDNSTTSHTPEVRFRYTYEGQTYESDLIRPSDIRRAYASEASAREEIAPFSQGGTVTALVSPALPHKAYLIRESSAGPIVFIVLGFLLPPIIQFASRWI